MRRAALSLAIGFSVLSLGSVAAAQAPPGTGTDLEIDPDAKPEEPPPEEKKEPELPPVDPNAWGVGGRDEEGRFAPSGKTGALKEQDDTDKDPPNVLPPPGFIGVDTVIGFGDTFVTDGLEPTEATVVSFLASAQYRFGETWTLGVRFPYSTGGLTGPAGSGAAGTFALGNIEIAVRPSFALGKRWRVPASIAFYIPLASGDLLSTFEDNGAYSQAIINQAASESRGWEEAAIFASKRLGFTPSVGIQYDRRSVHAAAFTKLEIIKRSGGVDPAAEPLTRSPTAVLHDPSTNWVTGLSFFYDFLEGRVSPGLRVWMAVHQQEVTVGTKDYSGVQLVLEPDVLGKVGLNAKGDLNLTGGLGFILPLGGHVGGADGGAGMKGLRLKLGLEL